MSRAFLDSNILVYAVSDDPKQRIAQELMTSSYVLSVQSLNEFASVSRRKLRRNWPEVHIALAEIERICSEIIPLTVELHRLGLDLAQRFGFALYDAMIVAAALTGGCDVLYSEDMHDGLIVDGRLKITNPFA